MHYLFNILAKENAKKIQVECYFISFLDFKNDTISLLLQNLEKDFLKIFRQDGYDKVVFQICYQSS
jgi:hypothetical protein